MGKKKTVTNAMRLLTAAGVEYEAVEYDASALEDDHFGLAVAEALGIPPPQSFKTLTVRGEKHGVFVCCIPVNTEADLKKLAKAAGEKKAEMVHVKELLALTGYVRGGVSPIGMKKKYPVFIDESCKEFDKIAVSAGVCGCTLIIGTDDLIRVTEAKTADLAADR